MTHLALLLLLVKTEAESIVTETSDYGYETLKEFFVPLFAEEQNMQVKLKKFLKYYFLKLHK